MEIRNISLTELKASKGMVLTDGKDYAKITRLAECADASKWYEIPESEYEKILAEQEKANELLRP